MSGIIGQDLQARSGLLGFPSGHVLQTLSDTNTTETNTGNATSWVATSLSLSITPSSTSSKILCWYSSAIYQNSNSYSASMTVFRGGLAGTNLGHVNYGLSMQQSPSSGAPVATTQSGVVLDSPSTTSATTYLLAIRESSDAITYYSINGGRTSLIVQEIAG